MPLNDDRNYCLACFGHLHENEQGDEVCLFCRWATERSTIVYAEPADADCFGCAVKGIDADDANAPVVEVTYERGIGGPLELWLCAWCRDPIRIDHHSTLNELVEQLIDHADDVRDFAASLASQP